MSSILDRRLFFGLMMLAAQTLCHIQCTLGFGFPEAFATTRNGNNNRSNYGNTTPTSLSKIPVVICPGFGNDQIDYFNPLDQGEEYGFVAALARRGFNPNLIRVLPLERYEWIRVAGGLFDIPNFYTGTCRPEGLGYGWYVKRLRRTIEEAYVNAGSGEKVIVIGHSAGGWLARAALGDGTWDITSNEDSYSTDTIRAADRVRALVTIGAIHKPPAGNAVSTCVTRGALSYLDQTYPGAYHSKEGVAYVSVGGNAIIGKKQSKQQRSIEEDDYATMRGTQQVNDVYAVRGEGSASSVAHTSYSAVSGSGEMAGDGVVPLEWALLEGSRTIVLDGVLHSINEAGTTLPTDKWYGAEEVVDRWLFEALEEAGVVMNAETNNNNFSWNSLMGMLPNLPLNPKSKDNSSNR
jgi:pimeloyl-ACP methyl ester carboxylesterase